MHWNEYLQFAHAALRGIPSAPAYALAQDLHNARLSGHTVYTCGNGGSASTASHLAQDLSKGTIVGDSPRLRCTCLCDSLTSLTAWANDEGYAVALAEQLRALGRSNDLLIALSGSGNSPNVLNAVRAAHSLGMHTWGVTGFDGGQLINLAHNSVHVPCRDMGIVEAAHGVLFHWLIDVLRCQQSARLSIMDEMGPVI